MDEIKKGDRVRLIADGQVFGKVLFIDDSDRITVLVDGYECSNSFERAELEKVE